MATIKQGDTVTILKGTRIRTTDSRCLDKIAGRTYKVKVKSLGSPLSIPVGHRRWDKEGNVSHEYIMCSRHDGYMIEDHFGEKLTDEEIMTRTVEGERSTSVNGTDYCSLFLVLKGPSVVWPGSGGYWYEVDVKDLPEAN